MANPATTLARASQDKRIPDLDALPLGSDSSKLSIPAYDSLTDTTYQAPIGGPAAVTNAIIGGVKVVQYVDSRFYGVPAQALTLDRLAPTSIVAGCLAIVANPASSPLTVTEPPQQYIATPVAAGTAGAVLVPRYIGAAVGDTVPIVWQESVSGVLLASELIPARQPYAGLTPRAALIKLLNEGSGSPATPVLTPGTAQGSDSVTFLSAIAS